MEGEGCKPGTPQEARVREHHPAIPPFMVSLKWGGGGGDGPESVRKEGGSTWKR